MRHRMGSDPDTITLCCVYRVWGPSHAASPCPGVLHELGTQVRVRVRVRVSKDLIFDCENANTPLHGKSIDPRFSSLSRFSSLL